MFDPNSNSEVLRITKSAHKIIPHLRCTDVQKTADFYTKDLHFELGGIHLDVPMVSVFMGAKAEANIYIFGIKDEEMKTGTVMVGLGRKELEEYHDLLVREGRVEIEEGLGDREWGFRQFDVEDLDGNRLQFWAFLDE